MQYVRLTLRTIFATLLPLLLTFLLLVGSLATAEKLAQTTPLALSTAQGVALAAAGGVTVLLITAAVYTFENARR
jgi:hypothetical protein